MPDHLPDRSMDERLSRLEAQMSETQALLKRLDQFLNVAVPGATPATPGEPEAAPTAPPFVAPTVQTPEPISSVAPPVPAPPPAQAPPAPAPAEPAWRLPEPAPEPVWTFGAPPARPEPAPQPASVPPVSHAPIPPMPPIPPKPVTPPAATQPTPMTKPIQPQPPRQTPPAPPQARRPQPAFMRKPAGRSWEDIIGRQWALWAGTALVFATVALLLAMNWRTLGPIGQLAIGALSGLALLGLGEWTRPKAEKGFAEGLVGGGLAVLYLDAWAAMARCHTLDFNQTLPLMVGITVLGVFMALRYDSISLSILSTFGGFLTPALLGGGSGAGGGAPVPFLTYVAVLNAGILAISVYKRWRALAWLSFAATVLLMLGWSIDADIERFRWVIFTYVTVYFLLYVGVASFYSLRHNEETPQQDLILLFADAVFYCGVGYALVTHALEPFPAAFPLALGAAFGLFSLMSWTMAPANRTLSHSGIGLGALFLTLAIPIQLRQHWLAIGWSLEAAVLLTLAISFGGLVLRRAGQIVWFLALLSTLSVAMAPPAAVEPRLFLNPTSLPLLACVVSTAWVLAWLHLKQDVANDEMAGLYAAVSVLGGAMLIGREVMFGFANNLIPWPAAWSGAALYVLAVLLAMYAVACFAAGLALKDLVVRSCAMAVAAVSALVPMWTSATQTDDNWSPFFNPRWLAFAISVGVIGLLGWMTTRENDAMEETETQVASRLPVVLHVLAMWGMTVEIIRSFAAYPPATAAVTPVVVGAFWCVYGAFLLTIGFGRRDVAIRVLAYLAGAGGSWLLVMFGARTINAFPPVGNPRFTSFVLAAGAMAIAARLTKRQARTIEEPDIAIAAWVTAVASSVLAIWGASFETYAGALRIADGMPNVVALALMGVSMVWSASCMVLTSFGSQWKRPELRWTAAAAGILGLLLLLVNAMAPAPATNPIINARFAAFMLSFLSLMTAAYLGAPDRMETEKDLPAALRLAGAAALLWGVSQETYEIFRNYTFAIGPDWPILARLTMGTVGTALAVTMRWVGGRFGFTEWRAVGRAVAVVAAVWILISGWLVTPMAMTPILNARFIAFTVSVLGLYAIGRMESRGPAVDPELSDTLMRLADFCAAFVATFGLIFEVYGAYAFYGTKAGVPWNDAALLAVAAVCAACAAAQAVIGWESRRSEMRYLGYASVLGGTVLLISQALDTMGMPMRPVINVRALAFVSVIAALAYLGMMVSHHFEDADDQEPLLPGLLATAAVLVGFWAITQETHSTFLYYAGTLGSAWERWAQCAISVVWTLFAFGLVLWGMMRHNRAIRWAALCLFGVSLIKVMLFDLSFLDMQYRILSTLVLGLALLAVAWFYSRYGIGREDEEREVSFRPPPVAGTRG